MLAAAERWPATSASSSGSPTSPWLGRFDAIISPFAIHHRYEHERKRSLYRGSSTCSNLEECSRTWSTGRRQPLVCIWRSSRRFGKRSRMKTRLTAYATWKASLYGCADSVSTTSTVTGSGLRWLCGGAGRSRPLQKSRRRALRARLNGLDDFPRSRWPLLQ